MPFYQTDVDTVAEEEGREPGRLGRRSHSAHHRRSRHERLRRRHHHDPHDAGTRTGRLEFVKWFTSPEIQAEWDRISGYFPTRAGRAEYLGDIVAERPQFGQALELLPYGKYEPQLISYQTVRDAAQQAFNEIMQGADVQATLEALNTEANELQEELMAEIQ